MDDIQEDIIKWINKQPAFLQEAASKLLFHDELTEEDKLGIFSLLKKPEPENKIIEWDHLFANKNQNNLKILSIEEIEGIENLSPREPIRFNPSRLTLIYGGNGAGKSGYTRILKRVSGKLQRELKPNVFKDIPSIQKCTIRYELNNKQKKEDWIERKDFIFVEDLKDIDIFDSEVAKRYLLEEKETSYNPPLLKLFRSLATFCDYAKDKLDEEQKNLPSSLPKIPQPYQETLAGKLYLSLGMNTKIPSKEEVRQHIVWKSENEKELENLTTMLQTGDVSSEIKKLRSQKEEIKKIQGIVDSIYKQYRKEDIENLCNLYKEAEEKKKRASEASALLATRLKGVGSETWRDMWEAARKYSQIVYPDQTYPVTHDGAYCVLCQQPISQDVQVRLKNFETFVQGELDQAAKGAENAFQNARNRFLNINPSDEIIKTQCAAAGIIQEEKKNIILSFFREILKIRKAVSENNFTSDLALFQKIEEKLVLLLQNEIKEREETIQRYEKSQEKQEREKLQSQKLELEARKWVSEQKEAIDAEIIRLHQIKDIENHKNLVNSRPITNKANEISEKLLTETYVHNFNEELKKLGAERIQVKLLKTRISKAKALHQIQLKSYNDNDKKLTESVLSEGERRIVALAAFLADAANNTAIAPFVFDDPISSLDGIFEEKVAKRLVELSQTRQVIILTHRLSFCGKVLAQFDESQRKSNIRYFYIENFLGKAGNPIPPEICNLPLTSALPTLIGEVKKERDNAQEKGAREYKERVYGFCTKFRILLERVIEEVLLNKVILRHRQSVTSENRLINLCHIEKTDCELFDKAMSKYSSFMHSQSLEAVVEVPDPNDLIQDIEEIVDWQRGFKDRKKRS